jgi:pyruvate dehydrogenase E2 component (dihydrolipoamide acetyltransferase)
MIVEVYMPALSPTMQSGKIIRWLKNEGDIIKSGEALVEIETDKTAIEYESSDDGILGKILYDSDHNINVGVVIALLLEEGDSKDKLNEYLNKTKNTTDNSNFIAESNIKPKVESNIKNLKDINNKIEAINNKSDEENFIKEMRVKASPIARIIAKSENIDLSKIEGTGYKNVITKNDVTKYLNNKQSNFISESTAEDSSYIINYPTTKREIIAQRLTESFTTTPHFYLSLDCNMNNLLNLRNKINIELSDNKISINDFIIKATALALEKNNSINCSWIIDKEKVMIKQYSHIDISVAVSLDDGLITPIIKNANKKTIKEISITMKNLIKKARDNRLDVKEFQGGSITISNLGMYGIKQFSAIINPPQSCILSIGTIEKRPIVLDNNITIGDMLNVTLSVDHRCVDGVNGAKFLESFKFYLENPLQLII